MNNYEVKLCVNSGKYFKTVVTASSPSEARKIVSSQYSGSICIDSIKKL